MKKLLSLILAAAITASLAVPALAVQTDPSWQDIGIPNTAWYDDAISADPAANEFEIGTAEELAGLAKLVNDPNNPLSFADTKITLTSNIDLGGRLWTPIGNTDDYFNGTFEGDNHVIFNLTIDGALAYTGLFGVVSVGSVSNLGIESGSVINNNTSMSSRTGAIVGYAMGDISDCYNKATVTSSGDKVGGITGDSSSYLINCYNTGDITGDEQIGGVVGVLNSSKMINCYNIGAVEGTTAVGGILGYNSYGMLMNSFNTGAVKGETNVGGILGYGNDGSVDCSSNIGTVEGKTAVGGVVGDSKEGSTLVSYNGGVVQGVNNPTNVGAVIGKNGGKLKYVYFGDDCTLEDGVGQSYGTSVEVSVLPYTSTDYLIAQLNAGNTALGIEETWKLAPIGQVAVQSLIDAFPVYFGVQTPVSDGNEISYMELEYNHFTDTVKEQIKAINTGTSKTDAKYIDVDAKVFERFPVGLVDILYGKDMVIRVTKDGKVYEVPCSKLPKSTNDRVFYTVDYIISLAK